MKWFLFIIACGWIAGGSAIILHTEKSRDFLSWLVETSSIRVIGTVITVLGLLLGIASFWSGVVWFLLLLAVFIIAVGIYLVVAPDERGGMLLSTWTNVTDTGYRLWGIIFVVTGMAVLAWI